jgi:hypothetical protein
VGGHLHRTRTPSQQGLGLVVVHQAPQLALDTTLAAGQKAKLKLKFAKKPARAIRRALARRKKLKAAVTVVTRGVGANASSRSTAKRKIKLRR